MLRKGLVIYEPRGRAGEYASLAVNLYRGCSHGKSIMPANESARATPFVIFQEGSTTTAFAGRHQTSIVTKFALAPAMASNILAGAASIIKLQKRLTTSALAYNKLVSLLRGSAPAGFTMSQFVPRDRDNLQILRSVIQFIAIYVMHKLSAMQTATHHLLGYQSMLITVSRNISIGMTWAFNSPVTMRTNCLCNHIAPPKILTPIITPCYKIVNMEVQSECYL